MADSWILVIPLAFVLLLWGIRTLVWWYWGIDRIVDALEDIAISLRTFPTVQAHDRQAKRRPPRAA
jgi:hypothetical protein